MSDKVGTNSYRIGAAERLSGVPAVTIRMWERRYTAVNPKRTESGDRVYSRDQIERLAKLRRLVDAGQAISTVAGLSDEALEQRLADCAGLQTSPKQPLSVALVGRNLLEEWHRMVEEEPGLILSFVADSIGAAMRDDTRMADTLIIAEDAIPPGGTEPIRLLMQHHNASSVMLVYQFATRADLQRLRTWGVHTVRSPLRAGQMRQTLFGLAGRAPKLAEQATEIASLALREPPPRLYTPEELADISRRALSVRCECPEHLVELVNKLAAFEDYSKRCESSSPSDAALHTFLHGMSAQVRRTVEDALEHVVAHELASSDR